MGLYGLWKSNSFSKGARVVGTLLILIGLIAFFNSNDSDLEYATQDSSQELPNDQIQKEIEFSPSELVSRFNEALSVVGKDYQLYLQDELFEDEDKISHLALPEGEEFMRLLINIDRSTEEITNVNIIHNTDLLSNPSKTLEDHLVAAILTIEGLDVSSDEVETIYGELTNFAEGTEEFDFTNIIDRNGFRFVYAEFDKGPLGSHINFGPIQRD